jgi:hypothetical protein
MSNSSLTSSHSSANIKAVAKTGLQRAAVSMIFKK